MNFFYLLLENGGALLQEVGDFIVLVFTAVPISDGGGDDMRRGIYFKHNLYTRQKKKHEIDRLKSELFKKLI